MAADGQKTYMAVCGRPSMFSMNVALQLHPQAWNVTLFTMWAEVRNKSVALYRFNNLTNANVLTSNLTVQLFLVCIFWSYLFEGRGGNYWEPIQGYKDHSFLMTMTLLGCEADVNQGIFGCFPLRKRADKWVECQPSIWVKLHDSNPFKLWPSQTSDITIYASRFLAWCLAGTRSSGMW